MDLYHRIYGQLLRRALPHVIRSEDELARLTDELARLFLNQQCEEFGEFVLFRRKNSHEPALS
jgi:hypothetical protein